MGIRERVCYPSPTRGLVGSLALQRRPGQSPGPNAFLAYFRPTEHFWYRERCYFTEQSRPYVLTMPFSPPIKIHLIDDGGMPPASFHPLLLRPCLRLIEKFVVDFPFVLIEHFSLGITAETLRANIDWKLAFLKALNGFGQLFI